MGRAQSHLASSPRRLDPAVYGLGALSRSSRVGHREDAVLTAAIAAMILFGGGSAAYPLPRFVAMLISAAMLVLVFRSRRSTLPARITIVDWLVVATWLLMLVQLIPLPPEMWHGLPGREIVSDVDRTVQGRALWRPLSLDPAATLSSVMLMIVPFSIYCTIRSGQAERRRVVLKGLLIGAGASLVLGLAQMLFHDFKLLQPYPAGDFVLGSGVFTNRNHQAAYQVCMIPLIVLFARNDGGKHRNKSWPMLFVWGGVLVFAGIMALGTASRMGALLLTPAVILTLAAVVSDRRQFVGLLLAGVAILGLVFVLGGTGVLAALSRGPLAEDQRWDFYPDTLVAVKAFWPVGSGLGTFVQAFQIYEPLAHLSPHFLNHAHNDYLEIALEAGLPGVVLAGAMVIAFLRTASSAWRPRIPGRSVVSSRLVSIPPLILLVHSAFDYPLRSLSVAMLFAACLAFQATPPPTRSA